MAQTETSKLDSGSPFPDFGVHLLDGAATTIRQALERSWAVLLLYRGHW